MADVYGFDAAGIRKIEEVVRRVMSTSYGKGGRRQRWPVPTLSSSSGSRMIRFRIEYLQSGVDDVANCTVLASTDGLLLGDIVPVLDNSAEGCFFTDETAEELEGRTGYAVYVTYLTDESSMTTQEGWEVLSLCCPAGS